MASYGQFSGVQPRSNRKMLLTGMSSMMLIAMVIGSAVAIRENDVSHMSVTSMTIETVCKQTDYQTTCKETLISAGGSDASNPKDLIKLAFTVTIQKVHGVMGHSKTLQEAQRDPMTAKALQNCDQLMDYAIDDLQSSLNNFAGGFDMTRAGNVLDDLRIWLSGAITFQETCLDGFAKVDSESAKSMRHAMKTSTEMTINVLAMVDGIAGFIPDLKIPNIFGGLRRLTSDEDGDRTDHSTHTPAWVFSPADRRKLLDMPVKDMKPNLVVAQDGSGDHKTINEALKNVPKKSDTPFIIYIKKGLYKETVVVEKSMTNLVIVGDGPTKTRISGNLNFIDGTPTFKTATLAVVGQNFIGKNFGVENTAGPEKHQAVALRVSADMSVFYNCRFDGYQDTLYVHAHRQFFRNCVISGTIDFIFGNSAVVFQNCLMLVRKPMDNQKNIVTAQGRKDRREPTGIVVHNCTFSADKTLQPVKAKISSYLGRPWKEFSRTFIMQSQIDDFIHADGWLPWDGNFALNTLFYTEFENRGPGAVTDKRVTWKGIKKIDAKQAEQYTAERFIQGDRWIKPANVPYMPGLLPAS